MYRGRKYRTEINKYKVNAGQNQAAWEVDCSSSTLLDFARFRQYFSCYCMLFQDSTAVMTT